jgi:FkbM family methyltransferase
VKAPDGRLGRVFLRLAPPLADLRRLPLIGPCLRWASARLVPRDSLAWVQVQRGPAKGIWLHLNPRTGSGYFNADIEPEVQAVLQKYLQPGMIFYDVGANIGFFALLAARLVGEQGSVAAFEADPEIASRLRENISRNQKLAISVEEKAVWCSSTQMLFARADASASPDRGLGHVIAESTEETRRDAIEVQAITLDEYAFQSKAPDFIKCDVEGAEVEVFRGAQKVLSQEKPDILCELHGAENRRILLEDLARFGYRCQPCGENHILAQHPERPVRS